MGAHVQARDAVGEAAEGVEHQNGHVETRAADQAQGVEPVHIGQHLVEERAVVVAATELQQANFGANAPIRRPILHVQGALMTAAGSVSSSRIITGMAAGKARWREPRAAQAKRAAMASKPAW